MSAKLFPMSAEDMEYYEKNAVEILEKNTQYATARVVERAFDALWCVGQFKWERNVAIGMLEELGLGFGEKIDGVYISNDRYKELLECERLCGEFCK